MVNNQQNSIINIEDLNNAAQQTLIHIDLDKTFYSITPAELIILETGSTSLWKDISLFGFGIGVPCAINAFIEYSKVSTLNPEIFWNSLAASVALIIAFIFSIFWYKSTNSCTVLINSIKQRPKYKIQ
ncbi:hypothetical protein [Flavobacterium sp.]|jgi:hypothetical protein|uniref:hypothetical protein n=1 Tax=Flavobacterium sp. TaxID=239 RepID=UPI0037BFDB25